MHARSRLVAAALAALALGLSSVPAAAASVDDFEAGLPLGADPDGILTGFYTFAGNGGAAITTTDMPPAAVPGAAAGNKVLRLDVDTTDFSGFVHVFEGPDGNSLAPRDWSAFGALSFWLYGHNTGHTLFIDVLDNRGGPSVYPFELWTLEFRDDFSGWQQLSFPFASLARKEIGNGAPNDGLGLSSVHGWALGTLATGGPQTYYVDGVQLAAPVPEPGTWALLCGGLLLVAGAARRRARAEQV